MNTNKLNSNKVTDFAKAELNAYLSRMGCPQININLRVCDLSQYKMENVNDCNFDDQYCIDVNENSPFIAANNPRALLLAVYRYLTLIGCRFLRPGKQHEIVPVYTVKDSFFAKEKHTASLRHRGVCIEGFDSIDNIADFIDWIPKIGFNSFFFQFRTPHTFLKRWYEYTSSFLGEWTEEDSQRMLTYFNELMDKRGLLRHRMGHGWTAEIIGAKNTSGWDNESFEVPEKIRPLIASVNGKRDLMGGIAVNTNLCMTNPDALNVFSKNVVDYLTENPDTEYLHIWLADGHHNFCECENCKDLTPADQYINLLNHLDSSLTKENINTKLCLLMYEDLFWPPVKNKLNNPERFALMFAPIHRTFNQSYSEIEAAKSIPEFNLNKTVAPKDIASNLAFLREWKKSVDCDSFAYDYYLGRAHHSEPTHYKITKIMQEDLKSYPQMGLNGIISCQELRVAFPNALTNYVMAKASLNANLSFEEIAKEYYLACYGKSGLKLMDLIDELSELFDCDYINYIFCPIPRENETISCNMKKVSSIIEQIETLIKSHEDTLYQAQEYMWKELEFFAEYTKIFARVVYLRADGQKEEAMNVFENKLKPLVVSHEKYDQAALDAERLLSTINTAIKA